MKPDVGLVEIGYEFTVKSKAQRISKGGELTFIYDNPLDNCTRRWGSHWLTEEDSTPAASFPGNPPYLLVRAR